MLDVLRIAVLGEVNNPCGGGGIGAGSLALETSVTSYFITFYLIFAWLVIGKADVEIVVVEPFVLDFLNPRCKSLYGVLLDAPLAEDVPGGIKVLHDRFRLIQCRVKRFAHTAVMGISPLHPFFKRLVGELGHDLTD